MGIKFEPKKSSPKPVRAPAAKRTAPDPEVIQDLRERAEETHKRAKVSVHLRLDADVLEAWRATGPGYHSRMNAALRKAII